MAEIELHELDDRIIALIEQNGRASYREIARQLDISERQVGLRLRRLIAEDVIRMITVVNAYTVGFNLVLTLGVEVADRPAARVAEDLAAIPNVIAAALMTGVYDIEIMVALEDHAHLAEFIERQLGTIPGIRSLGPSLLLNVAKYETGSGPVNLQTAALAVPDNAVIDEVDRAIISQLWQNASETNENIAVALGVSEATVRKRVNRLRKENLIHITAIRNVAVGRQVVFASIGLEIARGRQQDVVAALCALRQVHFVATVLGRYDVIAQVLVNDTVELSELLSDVIAPIDGVRRVDCAEAMRLVKYDYRWRVAGGAA